MQGPWAVLQVPVLQVPVLQDPVLPEYRDPVLQATCIASPCITEPCITVRVQGPCITGILYWNVYQIDIKVQWPRPLYYRVPVL